LQEKVERKEAQAPALGGHWQQQKAVIVPDPVGAVRPPNNRVFVG